MLTSIEITACFCLAVKCVPTVLESQINLCFSLITGFVCFLYQLGSVTGEGKLRAASLQVCESASLRVVRLYSASHVLDMAQRP